MTKIVWHHPALRDPQPQSDDFRYGPCRILSENGMPFTYEAEAEATRVWPITTSFHNTYLDNPVFYAARLIDDNEEYGGDFEGYETSWSYSWRMDLEFGEVSWVAEHPKLTQAATKRTFLVNQTTQDHATYAPVPNSTLFLKNVLKQGATDVATTYSYLSFREDIVFDFGG